MPERFKPSINPSDVYAITLGVGMREVSIIESYPTEELLEKGYKIWKQFAEERGLTKPFRVMFVDVNDNLTSYEKSNGRCMLTDLELIGLQSVN